MSHTSTCPITYLHQNKHIGLNEYILEYMDTQHDRLYIAQLILSVVLQHFRFKKPENCRF
jgi:hypothetical protein